MVFARLRALTPGQMYPRSSLWTSVEMVFARLRALTPQQSESSNSNSHVEMSIARLRALTCTMNNSECMKVCYSEFFKVFQSFLGSDFL